MLSTLPANLLTEPIFGNPFSSLENGFTPWVDFPEPLFSTTKPQPQTPNPGSTSGSDELNMSNSNSGSNKTDSVLIMDERKKRRMISNRESARRSRIRKRKHLENLRNHVTRLRVEKRDITNRLRYVLYHYHGLNTENHQLRSEQTGLQQRLNNIEQILVFRQLQQFTPSWPCNNINNYVFDRFQGATP